MIRFSAALVVVAIGVLIGGVATSSLLLVYVAIGISALALVVLAVGVALKREELFGDEARSATSGTPERAGQSAGLPEARQEAPSQPASAEAPVASGVSGYVSMFSKGDAAARGDVAAPMARGTDRQADTSRFPGQPGAWPPAEPGFPSAPVVASDPSSGKAPRSRRPAAPPTRADPVLPWADALPTRVNIMAGKSPEPVPSWLDDADDQAAPATLAARSSPAATASTSAVPARGANAETVDAETADSKTADPDTVVLRTLPSAEVSSVDVTGTQRSDSGTGDKAHDGDAEGDEAASGSVSPGVPDPAELTDEAVVVPDPEPDALSSVGAQPSDSEAPSDEEPAVGEPAGADESAGAEDSADDGESAVDRQLSGTEQVSVVPGVPRYHTSDCILIRFMDDEDVQRMTVAEAEKAGCTPCGACQSDD